MEIMKKVFALLVFGIILTACENNDINEEISEIENFEILATEQGDSTNSNGSTVDPDNEEE